MGMRPPRKRETQVRFLALALLKRIGDGRASELAYFGSKRSPARHRGLRPSSRDVAQSAARQDGVLKATRSIRVVPTSFSSRRSPRWASCPVSRKLMGPIPIVGPTETRELATPRGLGPRSARSVTGVSDQLPCSSMARAASFGLAYVGPIPSRADL